MGKGVCVSYEVIIKKLFLLMQRLFMQLNLILFKLPKYILNVSQFSFSIPTLMHFSSSL